MIYRKIIVCYLISALGSFTDVFAHPSKRSLQKSFQSDLLIAVANTGKKRTWRTTSMIADGGDGNIIDLNAGNGNRCWAPFSEGKELEEMVSNRGESHHDLTKLPGAQSLPGTKSEQVCELVSKRLDPAKRTVAAEIICKT